ncbi:hypothetical protein [Sedimenticola selenatireducens]|uniref:hypothetical protein n=1 Tax=Sedimenticola selenatireducens TaxID=191960 RepID=UPI0012F7F7BD|nr:hypothetical protein [Sedimenticola selenatireducens]
MTLQARAQLTLADHTKGIGKFLQWFLLRLQSTEITALAADKQVELILDRRQVGTDGGTQGFKQVSAGRVQVSLLSRQAWLAVRAMSQIKLLTNLRHHRIG